MNLDAVEPRGQCVLGPVDVLPDEVGHFLDLERPRRDEWDQFPLALFVLDECLAGGLDGRGRDREQAVRLQGRVRDASDVPELQEDQSAGLMHRIGDQSPALDLFAAVNARRPGIALSLHRHLGGFADDEGGRGTLRVITGVERGGDVARLAGARAGQRRHDDATPQVVAPDLDRLKQ